MYCLVSKYLDILRCLPVIDLEFNSVVIRENDLYNFNYFNFVGVFFMTHSVVSWQIVHVSVLELSVYSAFFRYSVL